MKMTKNEQLVAEKLAGECIRVSKEGKLVFVQASTESECLSDNLTNIYKHVLTLLGEYNRDLFQQKKKDGFLNAKNVERRMVNLQNENIIASISIVARTVGLPTKADLAAKLIQQIAFIAEHPGFIASPLSLKCGFPEINLTNFVAVTCNNIITRVDAPESNGFRFELEPAIKKIVHNWNDRTSEVFLKLVHCDPKVQADIDALQEESKVRTIIFTKAIARAKKANQKEFKQSLLTHGPSVFKALGLPEETMQQIASAASANADLFTTK